MTLAGKRIVVTRAPHQAGELADLLRAQGAEPLLYPCIAIVPPEDTSALDDLLRTLVADSGHLLVLTSANTVEAVRQRCEALGLSLHGLKAAAVGPATADAARDVLGLDVQIVPDEFVAEALAEAIHVTAGMRILLPQADIARSTLADALRAVGAEVTVVTAYRTVMGQGGVDLSDLLNAGAVDAITFTSSSTVTNCAARMEQEGGEKRLLIDICAACIGPKTAHTAETTGFQTILVPEDYTLAGLIDSLAAHFLSEGDST